MKAEYKRRHDEIWPELVALLKEAGVSDYSIHLDEETNIAVRRAVAARRSRHGRSAEASGDAALVGAHGRHHGDQAGQRAGRGAAGNRVPYGMTDAPSATSPSSISARPTPRWRWSISTALSEVARATHAERGRRATAPIRITMSSGSGRSSSTASPALNREQRDRRDLGHHAWRDGGAARRDGRAGAAGPRLRVRRAGQRGGGLRRGPPAFCRDRHAAPAGRPQSRRADLLAAEELSRRSSPRSPRS